MISATGEGDLPPIRYVLPGPFDWGLAKAHGGFILLASGLGYLVCLTVSIFLLRQVRAYGRPWVAGVVGVVAIVPMLCLSLASVGLQLTTAHDQETTHIPALVTIAVSFLLVVVVRVAVGLYPGRRGPSRTPHPGPDA